MNTDDFYSLDLVEPITRALRAQNHLQPTPIQNLAIPLLLEGRDLMGCAQTGSGKTAAFALPILQLLSADRVRREPMYPRALVLAPTRELAAQIEASFSMYGRYLGLKHTVVHGGVGKGGQIAALSRGVDILVATPGRLLDLEGEGYVRLGKAGIFVLDEADRMLDMGFIPDVRRVVALLPKKRQTLFFSATLSREIVALAHGMLTSPEYVTVTPEPETVPLVEEGVLFVDGPKKTALLLSLLENSLISRALVFTRTKHRANRLAEQLKKGRIDTDAIHGNKTQAARSKALERFHSGRIRVLVATDIAARGIDVKDISHVINFELPDEPECYLHRIGRTARAGKAGTALSFCDASEYGNLRNIERFLRHDVPIVWDHPFHSATAAFAKTTAARAGEEKTVSSRSRPKKSWNGGNSRMGGYIRRSRRS